MLDRFANVFYWLAILISALCVILAAYLYYAFLQRGSVGDGNIAAYGVAGFSLIIYGLGWAIRYILTGRTK
jgi:hypothetical protein